jgi:hypothetical protein
LAQDNPDKLTLSVSLTPLTPLIELGIARLQNVRSGRG